MKNQIIQWSAMILVAAIFSIGIGYVFAWTVPNSTPPDGNVAAPINIGSTDQEKEGDLCTTKGGKITCLSSLSYLSGTADIKKGSCSTKQIIFITPFSTAPIVTIAPKWTRFSGDEDVAWWVTNVTNTGFVIRCHAPSSGDNYGEDGVMWTAIGESPAASYKTCPFSGLNIASFANGSVYPFETFTTSGINITQAINTTGYGGARSDAVVLTAGVTYRLTYTLNLISGSSPEIKLVTGINGRDNWLTDTTTGLAVLNLTALPGTNSVEFIFPSAVNSTSRYLEVSVGNGVATNFSLTNVQLFSVSACQ